MKKPKPKYPWYDIIICPICKSKTFEYISSSEYGIGTVEQHGLCHRCGYIVEQAYSSVYHAFWGVERGFKLLSGEYISKNIKKHKRIRRKHGIKNIEVNPIWIWYV